MTRIRFFSTSTAFAAVLVSGMLMVADSSNALPLTPNGDQNLRVRPPTVPLSRSPTASAATGSAPTTGTGSIVHDHRKPTGGATPTSAPPPAAAPGTASTTTPPTLISNETRDHRPGGNADPCLQKGSNTCNAGARNTSIIEFRKKNPTVLGLDGDPCFQTKACTQSQLLESMIARAQKNLNTGWCDPRITGQGCAQKSILPGGKELVLHYDQNGGKYHHLLPADRQRLLAELESAYKKSTGSGGGGAPIPSGTQAQQQQ